MTVRISKGFRNFINEAGPNKQALANGRIQVYSGTQPTTADDAVTGTLLVTFTKASGAFTAETQATGTVTLTGGASGSVDTVVVNGLEILGGAVPFDTSLTVTAANVASKINNNPKNWLFVATSSAAVVTLTAKVGLGALPNAWVVTGTATTITLSYANMAGGVNSVNGLTFGDSANGTMVKNPSETWSGVAVANGTAGWFRFLGAVADAGAADSTETFIRLDGAIATSGADMNLTNTTIAASAVQTLDSFVVNVLAQ